MVAYCVAWGCKQKFLKGSGISLHSFPSNEKVKKQWVEAIRRENFTPSKHSKLCSKHFESNCFDHEAFGKGWKLKPEAVPTVFNFPEHLQEVQKHRNSPKKTYDNIIQDRVKFPSEKHRWGLREVWVKAVRRDGWKPTNASAVCSQHFRSTDMDYTGQTRRLREGAVPSVFPSFPKYLQKTVKEPQKKLKNRFLSEIEKPADSHSTESLGIQEKCKISVQNTLIQHAEELDTTTSTCVSEKPETIIIYGETATESMPRHDLNKHGKPYPSSWKKKRRPYLYKKKYKAVNSCSAELNGDVKSALSNDWVPAAFEDTKEYKFEIETEDIDTDLVPSMDDDDDSCHNNSSSLAGKVSSVCRFCASSDKSLVDIFSEEGNKHQLHARICTYLPIKVTEQDDLPLTMCVTCLEKLKMWNIFIINCLKTDITLKKTFGLTDACEQNETEQNDAEFSVEKVLDIIASHWQSVLKQKISGDENMLEFVNTRSITGENVAEHYETTEIIEIKEEIISLDTQLDLERWSESNEELTDDTHDNQLSEELNNDAHGSELSEALNNDAHDSELSEALNNDAHDSELSEALNNDAHDSELSEALNNDAHDSELSEELNNDAHDSELSEALNNDAHDSELSEALNNDAHDSELSEALNNDAHDSELSEALNNDAHDSELSEELNNDAHDSELSEALNNDAHDSELSEELNNDAHDSELSEELNNGAHDSELSEELNNGAHQSELNKELYNGNHDNELSEELNNDAYNNELPVNSVVSEISNTKCLNRRDLVEVIQPQSGKVVLNQKLLACVYCGVNFLEHKDLLFHQISMHGVKGVICFLCGHTVTYNESEDSLAHHILEYHKDITSTETEYRLEKINNFTREQPSLLTSAARMSLAPSQISLTFHPLPSALTQASLATSQIPLISSFKEGNSLENCVQNESHSDVTNTVSDHNTNGIELIKEKATSGNVIFWSSPTNNICTKTNNIPDGCSKTHEIAAINNGVDNLDMPSEGNKVFNSSNVSVKGTFYGNQENVRRELDEVRNTNILYYCDICHKTFKRKKNISLHMELHMRKKFPCKTCGINFHSSGKLRVHQKIHKKLSKCKDCGKVLCGERNISHHLLIHTEQQCLCDLCGEVCTSMYSLAQHKVKHKNRPLEKNVQVPKRIREAMCHVCGKIVRDRSHHMKTHEEKSEKPKEEAMFCCDTCGKLYKSRCRFKHHLTSHTSDYAPTYTCTECPKKFYTRSNLTQHALQHKEPKFACAHCDRRFRRLSQLRLHSRVHRFGTKGERLYRCFICQAVFQTVSDRVVHRRQHTLQEIDEYKKKNSTNGTNKNYPKVNSPIKKFQCDFCGKTFLLNAHLIKHCYTHTGEKPFKCSFCEACFTHKYGLVAHELVHTGERPYKCNVCDKGFRSSIVLNQHMSVHLTEMPFVCEICNRGFNRACNLRIHMRIHTNERPYACKICGRAFKQSGDRYKHERLHDRK